MLEIDKYKCYWCGEQHRSCGFEFNGREFVGIEKIFQDTGKDISDYWKPLASALHQPACRLCFPATMESQQETCDPHVTNLSAFDGPLGP